MLMPLEFDKDERRITELIQAYASLFIPEESMSTKQMLMMANFSNDIAELMLDARIESAVEYGGLDKETAESKIIDELALSEK